MSDGAKVLRAAREQIQAGPLPPFYSAHGEWCCWCAVAASQTALAETSEAHAKLGDWPLVEARAALTFVIGRQEIGEWGERELQALTQERALEILDAAIARCETR
jgi:hypothetical protein